MKSIRFFLLEAFAKTRSLWKEGICLNSRASGAKWDSGWALAAVSCAMPGPRHRFPWLEPSQAIIASRQVGNKYCRIVEHLKRSSRSGGLSLDRLQLKRTGVPGKKRSQMAGGAMLSHMKVPLPFCRKIRIKYSSCFWNGKREIKPGHQVLAPPGFPSRMQSRLKEEPGAQGPYTFPS